MKNDKFSKKTNKVKPLKNKIKYGTSQLVHDIKVPQNDI